MHGISKLMKLSEQKFEQKFLSGLIEDFSPQFDLMFLESYQNFNICKKKINVFDVISQNYEMT